MSNSTTQRDVATAVDGNGDAGRGLHALLAATAKFQRRFHESIERREEVWHRLAVKVSGGRVVSIQLITDENLPSSLPPVVGG